LIHNASAFGSGVFESLSCGDSKGGELEVSACSAAMRLAATHQCLTKKLNKEEMTEAVDSKLVWCLLNDMHTKRCQRTRTTMRSDQIIFQCVEHIQRN